MTGYELLIGGIGVVSLILLLSPFFSKKKISENDKADESVLYYEKEQIFTQLSELEYDYQMEKIAEEDYKNTKFELTQKAAKLITNGSKSKEEIETEVEHEIKSILTKHGLYEEVHYEN